MPKSSSSKICPRCGEKYSYIEKEKRGDNVYYYAVHYYYEDNKRKKKRCYLGAENYKHAAEINEIRITSKHLDPDFLFRLLDTAIDQLYALSQVDENIK